MEVFHTLRQHKKAHQAAAAAGNPPTACSL